MNPDDDEPFDVTAFETIISRLFNDWHRNLSGLSQEDLVELLETAEADYDFSLSYDDYPRAELALRKIEFLEDLMEDNNE